MEFIQSNAIFFVIFQIIVSFFCLFLYCHVKYKLKYTREELNVFEMKQEEVNIRKEHEDTSIEDLQEIIDSNGHIWKWEETFKERRKRDLLQDILFKKEYTEIEEKINKTRDFYKRQSTERIEKELKFSDYFIENLDEREVLLEELELRKKEKPVNNDNHYFDVKVKLAHNKFRYYFTIYKIEFNENNNSNLGFIMKFIKPLELRVIPDGIDATQGKSIKKYVILYKNKHISNEKGDMFNCVKSCLNDLYARSVMHEYGIFFTETHKIEYKEILDNIIIEKA